LHQAVVTPAAEIVREPDVHFDAAVAAVLHDGAVANSGHYLVGAVAVDVADDAVAPGHAGRITDLLLPQKATGGGSLVEGVHVGEVAHPGHRRQLEAGKVSDPFAHEDAVVRHAVAAMLPQYGAVFAGQDLAPAGDDLLAPIAVHIEYGHNSSMPGFPLHAAT
jgi:hypothetical protein